MSDDDEWRDQLFADPKRFVADLLAGYIGHPRLDVPEIAYNWFSRLDSTDAAVVALDQGTRAWLQDNCSITMQGPNKPGPRQNWVRQISEAIEVANMLKLPLCIDWLRTNQTWLTDRLAQLYLAPCRNPLQQLVRAVN